MRILVLTILLIGSLVAAADTEELPHPSTITYLLGGAVSGPYRLAVDLENDRLSEAKPPSGVRGDGTRMSAADIPETSHRSLTLFEREAFRSLGASVWRDGAVRRACFQFSMDALVQLAITVGGVERRSNVPAQCLTPDAAALLRTLLCAVDPGTGCS